MAAVSRSTIPSLLASICSNVVGSIVTEGLEGAGEEALRTPPPPPRRRPSETRGTPPSLAWTVRSCRSRRSLRTKVLLHFKHLKGRSFVSVSHRKLAAVQFSYSRQTGVVGAGGSSYIASLVTFERQLPRFGGGGGKETGYSRDRSCRLRCSLLLKARLQNWHLYFFSGADVFFAGELFAVFDALGAIALRRM